MLIMLLMTRPSTYSVLYFLLRIPLHQNAWFLVHCWGSGLMVLVSRGQPYQSVLAMDSNQSTVCHNLQRVYLKISKINERKLRVLENVTRQGYLCRPCSFATTLFGSSVAPPTDPQRHPFGLVAHCPLVGKKARTKTG